MFPKNKRIPRKMFPLLSNGEKTFKNNLFFLKFVLKNDSESRFCFSISKKVAKSAVVRNRMRRAGYRLLLGYISEIKSKILAVFSFRIVPKNDEEIIKGLESILKESKLIK
jgi:ribonuclease P protein component